MEISTLPSHGSLKLSSGENVVIGNRLTVEQLSTLVYTPEADFAGQDNFTVAMSANGVTNDDSPSTITISLLGTADEPGINNPTNSTMPVTVQENVDLDLRSLLNGYFTDPDGDSLAEIEITALPTTGALVYTKDGESTETTVGSGDLPLTLTATELATLVLRATDITGNQTVSLTIGSMTDDKGSVVTLTGEDAKVYFGLSDGNDAPTVTAAATDLSVAENGTEITPGSQTQTFADSEDSSLTFSLTGDDAALFNVDSEGKISFKTAPDYENPADANGDNKYQVTIVATDPGNLSASTSMTVEVTNKTNEASPVFTSATSVSVEENTLNTEVILTVAVTDAETTPTLSMLESGDYGLFNFDKDTGKLTFDSPPNFEEPNDANADNVYELEFSADDGGDDGGNTTTQTVMVTVTALNDNPPIFDASATPYLVEEGETATGYTASATDADDGTGGTLTYSLTAGYDNGLFSIDPSTGVLSFRSAPDY